MALHSSLRPRRGGTRHRNVLARGERLQILEEDGRWKNAADAEVTGLPKVRSIKRVGKKKVKKEKAEEGAAAPAAK